jgi:hypothetical protein
VLTALEDLLLASLQTGQQLIDALGPGRWVSQLRRQLVALAGP